MLEGDIYSRAFAGDAAHKLDVALANLSEELDDPALHDLVAPVVLAIAVPILYLTPLVWLLFRFVLKPTQGKNPNAI